MALTETPICDYGKLAEDFKLHDCFGNEISRDEMKNQNGLLVIFMCNHCPYVKAILPRFVAEIKQIQDVGIGCVAISSNDPKKYPEDNVDNMRLLAEQYNFSFPYCLDETQDVAKAYGAVCTPDFFGFNADLALQYRGRFDSSGRNEASHETKHELLEAMTMIANTGKGPEHQIPSIGCSIKWR
jgi:peroxiredoxin